MVDSLPRIYGAFFILIYNERKHTVVIIRTLTRGDKMSRTTVFLAFVLLISFPAGAQDISDDNLKHPSVKGWAVYSRSNISVIVPDAISYYLGFNTIYQNPDNADEYIREITVIKPFVVLKSPRSQDRNYIDVAITYVTDGAERILLEESLTESDPIVYISWTVKRDELRDTIQLDGKNEVWLWDSSGDWQYEEDVLVDTLMLSEPFEEFDGELLTVGVKYSFNKETYHAKEIPHSFLVIAVKDSRGGK